MAEITRTCIPNISIKGLCLLLTILIFSHCSQSTDPTESIPIFNSSPYSLVNTVIEECVLDTSWILSESIYSIGFSFNISSAGMTALENGASLDFAGLYYYNESHCISITDAQYHDTIFSWEYPYGGILFETYPKYFPLPDIINPLNLVDSNAIFGMTSYVNTIGVRIVSLPEGSAWIAINPRTKDILFPPFNSSIQYYSVIDSTVSEIAYDGSVIYEWPATIAGWSDATYHESHLIFINISGGTDYRSQIYYVGRNDSKCTLLVDTSDYYFRGVEMLNDVLYMIHYDSINNSYSLLNIDLSVLLNTHDIEASINSVVLLDTKYFMNPYGPGILSSEGNDNLLLSHYDQGMNGIVLLNTNGNIMGQWIVPFSDIQAMRIDASLLRIYARKVGAGALIKTGNIIEQGGYIDMSPVIWQYNGLSK